MRAVGLLLSLLVLLLSAPSWAENNLVIAKTTAAFVRPFDATAYAVGDLVANSAIAANVAPLQWNIAALPKNGAFIRQARISKTSTGVAAPNFRLHLFTTSPTSAVGDNGVYASTGTASWFCDLDINMFATDPFSDGNAGIGVPNSGAECSVQPAVNTVYGLLEVRGIYTPAVGEVFTVTLDVYSPNGGGGDVAATPPSWVLPGATVDLDFANSRYWRNGVVTDPNSILTYTRTGAETCQSANGNLSYVAANVPCINNLGYQSWVAATNLLLQSQFAATWSATRSTLTPNIATSPDATTDAATLIEDATVTSTHLTTQSVVKAASALPYVFSVYAKSGTRTRIDLQLDDNAGNGAVMVCDLANQTVGVTTAGIGVAFTTLSANVYGYSNGWTRCSITATTNTAVALVATTFLDNGAGTAAISNSYSGDGTSGVTIFGAQLEQVATNYLVPSPYIPTTVASATRAADAMGMWIGSQVGNQYTMLAAGTSLSSTTNNSARDLMYVDSGLATNRAIVRLASTNIGQGILILGNVTQYTATINTALAQQNLRVKIAMAMMPGLQLVAANGTISVTSGSSVQTNATILAADIVRAIHIGNSTTAAAQWDGFIDRITFFGNTFQNPVDLTR